jgi:hypothetical protein
MNFGNMVKETKSPQNPKTYSSYLNPRKEKNGTMKLKIAHLIGGCL